MDTLGFLLVVVVTAASAQDSDTGQELVIDVKHTTRRFQNVSADQGYKQWLVAWLAAWQKFILDLVTKPADQRGFHVHPKRWIVERTFAWFGAYRRLSKDYERIVAGSEGMIRVASWRYNSSRASVMLSLGTAEQEGHLWAAFCNQVTERPDDYDERQRDQKGGSGAIRT